MYFSQALEMLKQGKKVTRESWNSNGSHIELQHPDKYSKMTQPYLYIVSLIRITIGDNPLTSQSRVPWIPTQVDILADDWTVIDIISGRNNEMKNYVHRIRIIPNAGYGNPNQFKLLPVFKKGNHDIFAVNIDNEDENFVLFTRTKKELVQFGNARFNNDDILNIVDFIYDLAFKVFDERDTINTKYTFEIDFGNEQLLYDSQIPNMFNMDTIAESVITPGQKSFVNMVTGLNMDSTLRMKPHFRFIFRNFTPDDCKLYFFRICEKHNTTKCCKTKSNNKMEE